MRYPSLKSAIDAGADLCTTRRALAARIGMTESNLGSVLAGRRPMPSRAVAELADVLQLDGDEARELLALAEVENPANASAAARMRAVLFACWVVGGAALSGVLAAVQNWTVYTLWRLHLPPTRQAA